MPQSVDICLSVQAGTCQKFLPKLKILKDYKLRLFSKFEPIKCCKLTIMKENGDLKRPSSNSIAPVVTEHEFPTAISCSNITFSLCVFCVFQAVQGSKVSAKIQQLLNTLKVLLVLELCCSSRSSVQFLTHMNCATSIQLTSLEVLKQKSK